MPQILDRYYGGDQAALQPGVMGTIASTGITGAIGATTRVLTLTNFPTGDTIWFNVSGLMVPATMPAPGTLTVGTIATSGQFAGVAVDAVPPTTPGGPCSYVVSKGADQTTAALASTNQAAVTPGNIRIWDGIMSFVSPNYTLVAGGTGLNLIPVGAGRDRRPWARGCKGRITRNQNAAAGSDYTTTSTTAANIDATNLAMRVECGGVGSLKVMLRGHFQNDTAGNNIHMDFTDNGSEPDGAASALISGGAPATALAVPISLDWDFYPASGSHLIIPRWFVETAGTARLFARSGFICYLGVAEDLRPNANNGTA